MSQRYCARWLASTRPGTRGRSAEQAGEVIGERHGGKLFVLAGGFLFIAGLVHGGAMPVLHVKPDAYGRM